MCVTTEASQNISLKKPTIYVVRPILDSQHKNKHDTSKNLGSFVYNEDVGKGNHHSYFVSSFSRQLR